MAAKEEYMTFEQRLAFARVVAALPENEGPYIYRIVLQNDPEAFEECEEDPSYIYVLFHLLQPVTLQELENYIASREVNTQRLIQENDPDSESEESSTKPTPSTEKLSSKEGSKSDTDDEAESKSIKTRLRKNPKKSEAGSSKKK